MKRAHSQAARLLANALENPNTVDWITTARRALVLIAPPKKKIRARDPIKAARRASVKELDALCREIVFARARRGREGGASYCEWCAFYGAPEPAVDWAHFYSRRFKWLRWSINPRNSAAFCKGCHLKWHHRPTEGAEWAARWMGGAEYQRLVTLAARPQKTNLALVRIHLEAEAKRLGVKIEEGK